MITKAQFRMVEILQRSDIEEHPVWADFHGGADRRRVLGWGIDEGTLDGELHKYDYCGRSPLYPVLDADTTAFPEDLVNPSIGLRLELDDDLHLDGYRVGVNAFVVFAGDDEFCFNTSLPARWEAEAERLAAVLHWSADDLFPLAFEERARFGAPSAARGTIEAPEPA